MTATPRLELIAAMAANGVIGRGGELPWRLPDDLKRFRQLTLGHPVIMGRKTYDSIGKPLPGRVNIVVSAQLREPPHPDVTLACSLDEALALAAPAARVFVIGGATIYESALQLSAKLHLTELDEAVAGDTFFPPFDRSQWRLIEDLRHERDDRHAHAFHLRTYVRA